MKKVNKWIINNLSLIGAAKCELCGAESTSVLCSPCKQEIETSQPCCNQCALPLPIKQDQRCGSCQSDPPAFRSVYRYSTYAAPLDQMIVKFKFQQKLSVGKRLGELMADDIVRNQLPQPDVLLPVPLHPSRLRARGYNQALELARPIATKLGLPLDVKSCQRRKATKEQTGLSATHRKSNLKNAFEIKNEFKDKKVVVIDDVMTTGSTVNEISRQLLKAGARYVDVWVCARADL